MPRKGFLPDTNYYNITPVLRRTRLTMLNTDPR